MGKLFEEGKTMQVIEAEIVAMLRDLPQTALEEAKVFIDFLAWRYHSSQPEEKCSSLIRAMRGKANTGLTTDEIINLSRSDLNHE